MLTQEIILETTSLPRQNPLPSKLVQIIENSPWQQKVAEIGKSNNLSPQQIEAIQMETLLVLGFLEEPGEFPVNVGIAADLNLDTVENVSKQITDSVFSPIFSIAGPYIEKVVSEEMQTVDPSNLPEKPSDTTTTEKAVDNLDPETAVE